MLSNNTFPPPLTVCSPFIAPSATLALKGRAVLSPLSGHFPLLLDSRRCPQYRSRIPT